MEATAPDFSLPHDASNSDAATKAPSALFQMVRYALFMSLPHHVIEIRTSRTQAFACIKFIQDAYLLIQNRLIAA
jgi:hypothetical protein